MAGVDRGDRLDVRPLLTAIATGEEHLLQDQSYDVG